MALLELHVWGRALELPSIDPECLAALSCFDYAVPRADWALIASNDTSVSPDHILPALHHKGTWVSGYLNIVSYLAALDAYRPVDRHLTPAQRADALAHASYLTSRGAALVAFSLYVSPSAWADVTRPAYSSLLPFPLTWTVPPGLRAAAAAKTEHLGLSRFAADVDPADGTAPGLGTTAPTTSTGFLRLPNVRPRLGASMQPEHAAAIRLQSLAEDFFAVLDELRGPADRYFFGSDAPSSLDFLAYSYLKFMLVKTPHPFYPKCMQRSAAGKRLIEFLEVMEGTVVRPLRQQNNGEDDDEGLPWVDPKPRTVAGFAGRFAGDVVGNIPGVGESWTKWYRGGVRDEGEPRDSTEMLLAAGSAAAALAALGAVVLFKALSPFGAVTHRFEAPPEKGGRLSHRSGGVVDSMLDGLPDFEPPPRAPPGRDTLYQGDNVAVAVDVESEGFGMEPPRDSNYAEAGVGVKVGDETG